jgi:GT2 family glycosyltransferase
MNKYDIVASIVLYKNDRSLLQKAIGSFLHTDLHVKLYLIDNSPTQALRDLVTDDRVEYIFNNANLGFGKAHNIALTRSMPSTKYNLILNPDVKFGSGTLERLYRFAEDHPDVGMIMPKILDFEGEIQYLCKRLPRPGCAPFLVQGFSGLVRTENDPLSNVGERLQYDLRGAVAVGLFHALSQGGPRQSRVVR